MSLLGGAVRLLGKGPWQEFVAACRDPRATQERLLSRIVAANQGTRFGSEHHFDADWSSSEFRLNVPVRDHDGLRSYLDRVWEGEPDVLTREPVLMFTTTSGTTGKPKYIPITKSASEANSRLSRAWYFRSLQDHPSFLDGRILGIVSPEEEGRTPQGVPYGAASGRLYRRSPWVLRHAYAVPYVTFGIDEYEAKYYAIARFAIEAPVTFVGTPNPSTLVRIAEVANRHREELIRDLHDGTLSTKFDIATGTRDYLSRALRANPARARTLERLVATHGVLRPRDYWQDLRLIGCWKGGSVSVQLENARRWFGDNLPIRDLGYLASEALMSLPIQDEGAEGALAVTANFFEFIPEGDIDSPGAKTLLADQLETGGRYYVVVTTQAGLYRCDMNDIIQVTGFFHSTPLIEFVRKGRDMTSIGGEKLHVAQVIEAVEGATRQLDLSMVAYRAIADAAANSYAFLFEPTNGEVTNDRLTKLLCLVDERLGLFNLEYRSKRTSGRLGSPCLYLMRPGWYERRVQRRVSAGARDTQFKASLLNDDFEEGEQDDIECKVAWPPRG